MATSGTNAPTRSQPKRIWRKRLWRTAGKKRDFTIAHIRKQLSNGPKTFDDLHEGIKRVGVTEHYLSDILGDLLLYDGKIITESDGERRIYQWIDSQK